MGDLGTRNRLAAHILVPKGASRAAPTRITKPRLPRFGRRTLAGLPVMWLA